MAKFDRKAAKKQLLKRTEEQNQKKNQGQFGSIFKRSDLPMWSVENGKHKIDIIPYLAGKHDPNVPKGEPTYLLDIWVHRNVGVSDDPYVCLSKNYKQNCPICTYRKEYESQLEEDMLDALRPKRRTVYNVVCRDSDEERKKGVQVFEISHHFMEKNILPQAENPDTGGVIAFSDPEEGMTVFFKRSGTKDKQVWDGHKLLPRDYKISDKILDQAFTLDEIIHIPTEEELERVVKGLKKKSKTREEEDSDDEEEDDEEETTTSRRKKKSAKDEDDVDDADFEDEEEEDDEPKKKSKKSKKSSDDDEEEEEEEDDEPKKKGKGKKSGKGKCPEGGTFGKDFDKFDGCVDCGNFDECSDANDALSEEAEDDDEEEDDEPKKKKGKDDKKKKKPVDDDDDEEEEEEDSDGDDDDEDEPKKKSKKSKFNRRTGR